MSTENKEIVFADETRERETRDWHQRDSARRTSAIDSARRLRAELTRTFETENKPTDTREFEELYYAGVRIYMVRSIEDSAMSTLARALADAVIDGVHEVMDLYILLPGGTVEKKTK